MAKIEKVFVRQPGNYDPVEAGNVDAIKDYGPSMTVQSDSEDADINVIVKRFGLTGQLPQNARAPVYADFENVFDFHSAQNAIAAAQQQFMALPAAIRARFSNDPQQLLEFVEDPTNLEEARKLGLAVPAKAEEPRQGTQEGSTAGNAPGGASGQPGGPQGGDNGTPPAK